MAPRMRTLLRRIFRKTIAVDTPETGFGRRRVTIGADRQLIYAIGDVHGCLGALRELEDRIRADIAGTDADHPLIVYLGDYVDRGPDSRGVMEHLSRRHPDGIERIALCGNHDDAFLQFLRAPADNIAWLDFGGDATLRSYGLGHLAHLRRPAELRDLGGMLREAIPADHIRLLEELPVLAVQGQRLFVHAGIRPGVAIDAQADADLLWIREPFLDEGPGQPLTVIHGHTAGVEPVFADGRICIDTGCYATGRLTALRLTGDGTAILSVTHRG